MMIIVIIFLLLASLSFSLSLLHRSLHSMMRNKVVLSSMIDGIDHSNTNDNDTNDNDTNDTNDTNDNDTNDSDTNDSDVIDDGTIPSNLFVILSNLQSGSNIGSICRNCLAFNVREVIVIGRKNYKDKMRGADRGAKSRLKFKSFNSIPDAAIYLKTTYNATIVGVEITDGSSSLLTKDFKSNDATVFIFGNEGGGLSQRQRDACDEFVYIPQYRSGMASVNVACCSAIVLNYYAANMGFKEVEKQQNAEKFIV